MSDPIRTAIEKLSIVSNTATGLAHPLDETRAKELFVALHQRRVPLLQESIREHAEACGWPPAHAQKLGELAARIGAGIAVRIPHPRGWGETVVSELLDAATAGPA
jgi:hypothetical protein